MSLTTGYLAAVAAFQLRQHSRSLRTLAALTGFMALLAVGHWSVENGGAPSSGDRLFGYAYVMAAVCGLRLGIAADVANGTAAFLVGNFVSPARYLAGKLLALLVQILALATFAFLLSMTFSGGDLRYSLWYPALFTLVTILFLPAICLAELALAIQYPGAAVLTGFVALLAAAQPTIGAEAVVEALALAVVRFDPGSLLPLLIRATIASAMLPLALPLLLLRIHGTGRPRLRP